MSEIWINIKNQKRYKVINTTVIDATNEAQERLMVLYKDGRGIKYVRERNEFLEKFRPANIQST